MADSVEAEVLAPEPPSGPVQDIRQMKTLDEIKSGVAMVLSQYEENRVRLEGERRMDEVWAQCSKVDDTNQNVLMIMNQCFVLFQNAYDRFLASQKNNEAYVRKLKKTAEDLACERSKSKEAMKASKLAVDEEDRYRRDTSNNIANLRGFAKTVTELAHEYRACRTQEAYYFHISQLNQFMSVIIAVLHQQIPDARILKSVSEALESACLKLFPVGAKQDA